MILLFSGILLWSALHFFPSLAPDLRRSLKQQYGDKTYQISFAIGVVLSIVLMVVGWRYADQWSVYEPFGWGQPLGALLVLVAFIFIGLSHGQTNLKLYVRHPQLVGLIIWTCGHLLANGDNLSILLFGGLGLWAIVEILLLNRRDGDWIKPEKVPLKSEIRPILISFAVFFVFLFAHPLVIGVSPLSH